MLDLTGSELKIVITIETLVGLLIVFLNSLVFVAILRPRNKDRLRSPANILVANLAIVDVFRGLTSLPSQSAHHVGWPHNFTGCLALVALENGLHKISCLGFIYVSLERYIAICHPFRHPVMFSDKAVVGFCVSMWIVGAVVGVLPVVVWNGGWDTMMADCDPMMMYPMSIMVWWNAIGICITFTIYVIVIYSLIGAVIVRHRRQIRDQSSVNPEQCRLKNEMRGTLRCFLIVLTFALTRLPLVVLNIANFFAGVTCSPCRMAFDWLRILQSAANPLLYAFGSTRLRREMTRLLGCSTGGRDTEQLQTTASNNS